MFTTLHRYNRPIAWIFTGILYCELILSGIVARANSPLAYVKNDTVFSLPEKPASIVAAPDQPASPKKENKTSRKFTTGPTQPETQSFQSVNTNNMVDLFTGDFSYNIPLLDVGGYPVNLHYQSGITMSQEASWVGLGWNINPGAVTRNMRGLPDDFKGDADQVTKTFNIKENKTIGVTVGFNAEFFGVSKFGVEAGASIGILHNTYKGWGTEMGINANINAGVGSKGALTAGLALANNSQEGLDISPSLAYKFSSEDSKTQGSVSIGTNYNSRAGIQGLQITGQIRQQNNDYKKLGTGVTGYLSFSRPAYTPMITPAFTSSHFAFTAKVGGELTGLHPNLYVRGYGSNQRIHSSDWTTTLPAYGYLYYEQANGNQKALLDFNREKDIAYHDKTPHIAIPMYTYDTYSISGEGTGGMFRPYRSDIGFVFDHAMTTKNTDNKFSLDLGGGTVLHTGIDFNTVYATTENRPWLTDNALKDVTPFSLRDTSYENVYFKNPGEKTLVNAAFMKAIGGDSLIRVNLEPVEEHSLTTVATRNFSIFKDARKVATRAFTPAARRTIRDKRTQVISYLTAEKASVFGLEKQNRSYNLNSFPSTNCVDNYEHISRVNGVRKGHHLSEITVLNTDGKRYVYGVPVYNIKQTDVTMATGTGDNTTGLVAYTPGNENSTEKNTHGDRYYKKEDVSGYAHSFLLSGILSPDYVDITGDGVTEDDNGEAIRFNYTRAYGDVNPYRWRAPYESNKASYNEGLKTDNRDEKGSFTYGTKEVWYLNSVESKNMIATFVLENGSVRSDAFGVASESGGKDEGQKLRRLKEINLYTKSDLMRNGIGGAKPIKTVHFEYDYSLCKGAPGTLNSETGKLTLTKVWFTYNKNAKGKKNPYVFKYRNNKNYANTFNDNWGNYKDPANNPATSGDKFTNADFAYPNQKGSTGWDSATTASNAAAWHLDDIRLPSGGKIKVTYEADDYAYVQNKRASQLTAIAGFGSSPTDGPHNKLYQTGSNPSDYKYVFINVPVPVSTKGEVYERYLQDIVKLYFKVFVKMPEGDKWGKGYELVPGYAEIENYGVKAGSSNSTIWIQLKPIHGNESPVATAALQFLRLNLPSKAYPNSEPGESLDIRTVINTLATSADNIINSIKGFSNAARKKGWCSEIRVNQSFVRLNNPYYKKFGGGHRVKKVEIYDNWNTMTKRPGFDGQTEAVYGQQYDYTTRILVNGDTQVVSSGVASYEPVIGGEENPFRVPSRIYAENVSVLAPANYTYSEEPLGETFFPSPMVGYSEVTVKSIHYDKKSATGIDKTEFYTAKDFPSLVEFTPIDNDSKKTFNPKINNFFKFNAQHLLTISQGFKVELNDMHGKMKSQASFSQNDLTNAISYTKNYYRLKTDDASTAKLSNKVAVADTANGHVDHVNLDAEIGKDVEIMIDVREQTSKTISGSIEANLDWIVYWPPIITGMVIPLPSFETSRYRAVAVLKVVNRYGILDSIIHVEKGSQVTTKNLVYDAETGDVLLSQTNNEFDDPVYNFNYPAHWAYSGMGMAYKNTGSIFKNVLFKQGKLYYSNGIDTFPVSRFFESGDEISFFGKKSRLALTNDLCSPLYFAFTGLSLYDRIWAIDASKGKEKNPGIYFIDKNGKPFSGLGEEIMILRSGKRNMGNVSVGSITSLKSPLTDTVGTAAKLLFDSTRMVINAVAARFNDFWRVDSTSYAKDTVIIGAKRADSAEAYIILAPNGYYSLFEKKENGRTKNRWTYADPTYPYFEARSYDQGGSGEDFHRKSWLLFDVTRIPKGAVVKSAELILPGSVNVPHLNQRGGPNSAYVQRALGPWIRQTIPSSSSPLYQSMIDYYFQERYSGIVDVTTQVTIPATQSTEVRNENLNVTSMAQAMIDDYYAKNLAPSISIRLINSAGDDNGKSSRLSYRTLDTRECPTTKDDCDPRFKVVYYLPCAGGSKPVYSATPVPGYYCYDVPKDTFVCRPNIDTVVNPYRWGILGNWRLDRAYTYYNQRKQSDPTSATNIRTNGEINQFEPYWSFTNALLTPSVDSSRWVWNSEMTKFNRKGYEIENHDPLDRYNSGQYGYNQSLPVAVAQNARNREMVFDGWEDYNYRTDTCIRCQDDRFLDLGDEGEIVNTVSHTGRHSLFLDNGQSVSRTVPLGTFALDTVTAKLSIKIDSTPLVTKQVTGNGTGLKMWVGSDCYGWKRDSLPTPSNINFLWGTGYPPPLCPSEKFLARWKGFIQPRFDGLYTFHVKSDDWVYIWIKKNNVTRRITRRPNTDNGTPLPMEFNHDWFAYYSTDTITLEAGELYEITVHYEEAGGNAFVQLAWSSQGAQSQPWEIVPASQLYSTNANIATVKAATIDSDTTWCVKMNGPKPTRVTLDRFSPLAGTKIVVSAWITQPRECITERFENADITLSFNDTEGTSFFLSPRGPLIDGWQRIEETLTIPEGATTVNISLNCSGNPGIYFDDIRIHPYNSNMKSFVYDPVNLRLMAELDENNYATFYEYDDDGTLIRVKKETQRGVKTIKETRSALLKDEQ